MLSKSIYVHFHWISYEYSSFSEYTRVFMHTTVCTQHSVWPRTLILKTAVYMNCIRYTIHSSPYWICKWSNSSFKWIRQTGKNINQIYFIWNWFIYCVGRLHHPNKLTQTKWKWLCLAEHSTGAKTYALWKMKSYDRFRV